MRFNDIKKIVTESKEQLEDRLYDLEAAVRSARDITKQIKYADTHLDVIRELENLAQEVGVELDVYNVRQVYQANNNLESAIYELESAFVEAKRDVEMKLDDLEFEEGADSTAARLGKEAERTKRDIEVCHVCKGKGRHHVTGDLCDHCGGSGDEPIEEGKNDSWYAYKEAEKKWAKDTGQPKEKFAYAGTDVQDEYIEPEMKKRGYVPDEYQGKGVTKYRRESLEALARHVKEGVPLPDSLFRYQSEAYFDTFKQAKQLREMGSLPELDWESEEMLGTDIGESVALKGIGTVWLDVPYLDESDDYEMTTCDYCHGNEWDPDGPQYDDDHDDCPKCAGTGEIPKDDLGGSLTSEGSYQDPVRDIINRNGGSKLLQQYADGEKQFYGTQMFDELYDYYSNSGDMPYGTMTGDDGDAEVWILDELESEGYVDHPSDGPEDCMACGGTGFDPDQPEKSCKACDGEGYDDGYFGGTKAYEDINKMRKLAGLPEAEYNGKKVQLNKPKRGGSKKYYVYVKNPKTDRVKKISFGDPGLKTKSGNKSRAKSFAARHNCEKKNDKMKAGYWACRLPRYGLVKGGKWW